LHYFFSHGGFYDYFSLAMGLFGGGNSTTNTSTTVQNYEGTSSNEIDAAGAGNALNILNAPQAIGGSTGGISTTAYYAPLYVTPSINLGDDAVQAAQQTAQSALSTGTANQGTVSSTLSSLFSGDNLYAILFALVAIMLWRGHAGKLSL
jgi:preprotein translocase subunit SecF